MSRSQTCTEFFESIIEDRNVPEAQVLIFFSQAYHEKKGNPEEQLRLLDLLKKHRPKLEAQAAADIIHGH